jgi:hypothetical protein
MTVPRTEVAFALIDKHDNNVTKTPQDHTEGMMLSARIQAALAPIADAIDRTSLGLSRMVGREESAGPDYRTGYIWVGFRPRLQYRTFRFQVGPAEWAMATSLYLVVMPREAKRLRKIWRIAPSALGLPVSPVLSRCLGQGGGWVVPIPVLTVPGVQDDFEASLEMAIEALRGTRRGLRAMIEKSIDIWLGVEREQLAFMTQERPERGADRRRGDRVVILADEMTPVAGDLMRAMALLSGCYRRVSPGGREVRWYADRMAADGDFVAEGFDYPGSRLVVVRLGDFKVAFTRRAWELLQTFTFDGFPLPGR